MCQPLHLSESFDPVWLRFQKTLGVALGNSLTSRVCRQNDPKMDLGDRKAINRISISWVGYLMDGRFRHNINVKYKRKKKERKPLMTCVVQYLGNESFSISELLSLLLRIYLIRVISFVYSQSIEWIDRLKPKIMYTFFLSLFLNCGSSSECVFFPFGFHIENFASTFAHLLLRPSNE